jgi:hypothetical protein
MNGKGLYVNSEVKLEGYFENDNFIRPLNWNSFKFIFYIIISPFIHKFNI